MVIYKVAIVEEDECVGECRIAAAVPRIARSACGEFRVKAPSSRELMCVDLRGMRAALVEQARARGVSPSEFLRGALADALRSGGAVVTIAPENHPRAPRAQVRLSLRMSNDDRDAVLARARQAGLTPGAFVAGLVAGIPVLTSGQSRDDHLAALIASNAEMATLARNVGQLVGFFRQGSTQAAHECRTMRDGIVHVGSMVAGSLMARRAAGHDHDPRRTV